MNRKAILVALAASALALAPGAARASFTYGFTDITSNADPGTQYTMTAYGAGESFDFGAGGSGLVTVGAGQVLFVFQNSLSVFNPSSITQVYFQDGTLLSLGNVYETSGVSYHTPATPGNLPGGNSLDPAFKTTQQWSADPNPPVEPNGVDNTSEAVGILFNLKTNPGTGLPYTLDDVNNALVEGFNDPTAVWTTNGSDVPGGPLGLRVGIHVQGYSNLQSQAFVNNIPGGGPPPFLTTPAPPSAVLIGLGAGLYALLGRADGAPRRRPPERPDVGQM
jgi:hypothetical protein